MNATIKTNNLVKRYDDVIAVDGLSLHVGAGEIYAFLGLNGAGKTTTIRMLLGIISAKAQIIAGSADWQTYLGFLAQATAIGGFILFALISSWVFGREYADHTPSKTCLPCPPHVPLSCLPNSSWLCCGQPC